MENREAGTNDDTIQCLNNCGKEIKNMEDHRKDCPLQAVKCEWCGLIQPRNSFKEHIILANPELEAKKNKSQQCMQRQYAQLENYSKKHDDALKKLSDDKDGAIQRLSGNIQNINNSMHAKIFK